MNNFDELIDLSKNIVTTYKGKILVIKKPYLYFGPVTLQYLPNGGIQTIYQNQLVINCKNGFIASKEVEYDGQNFTIEEFAKQYGELVNTILPN